MTDPCGVWALKGGHHAVFGKEMGVFWSSSLTDPYGVLGQKPIRNRARFFVHGRGVFGKENGRILEQWIWIWI